MRDKEYERVVAACTELRKQGKKEEPDRIIAELNFGFWTSLFIAHYEKRQILWPRLLKDIFPYMPRSIRKRNTIWSRLDTIRQLRNRVSHHERIYSISDLFQQHAHITESIGWIYPDAQRALTIVDRFPDVYQVGLAQVRGKVESLIQEHV